MDFEVEEIEGIVAHCDGGNKDLGHPLVYLNTKPKGYVICPYCNKKFVSILPKT